ncbi:MAG: Fic family protein, partial [bacterium]|nr:Fic family protein [bacterium]
MAGEVEAHHLWLPITDLEDDSAASTEIPHLLSLWEEQREELSDRQVLDFNERLNREWAIETGIIEGIYNIDQGTTQLLIERGIDASLIVHDGNGKSPELIAGIVRDHQDAVEWLFDVVKQQRSLSTSFVKELHHLMTRKQDEVEGIDQFGRVARIALDHGFYKQHPNNPIRPDGKEHQYCPPEQVSGQMDELVRLHLEHAEMEISPDISAAWLHHRFTQIHPFQDGNGRVARALASLVLIRAGWFPLVISRTNRGKYIDALEHADAGDIKPLVRLFITIQKDWFLKALSISKDIKRDDERLEQMLASIHDDFSARNVSTRNDHNEVKQLVEFLSTEAQKKFEEVQLRLESGPAFEFPDRRVYSDCGLDGAYDRRSWYRKQVIDTAKHFDYWANSGSYHSWVRIVFITETGRSEILLSFHTVGREFRGVIGATMCFFRKSVSEDDSGQVTELQPVCDEVFQLNYKEEKTQVIKRFEPWLESALFFGLNQW